MSKQKIKLALLTVSYIGGGSSFNELAMRLDPDRFEIICICLKRRRGDPDAVDKDGHKVFYLSGDHRIHALEFGILRKLVRILKTEKVDIVHCHRHKPGVYAACARLFIRVPVVFVHVHGISRTKNFRRKLQNLFLFRVFNKVIGCSIAVRNDVRKTNPGVCPDKITALENSIDYERYANVSITKSDARREKLPDISYDAFIFGMVARFGPYKGHDVLVSAFEQVKARVPAAELVLIGDGPERERIERQAKETGLGESIHFLGRRDDVGELLRALDVFVLPSVGSEGMPLSILEAMSSGVPCLSTDLSGIPEVINSADVGKLVEPGDKDALADAMISYCQMSDQQRSDIIENARKRVKTHFSHESLVSKVADLYENELKSNSRGVTNVQGN